MDKDRASLEQEADKLSGMITNLFTAYNADPNAACLALMSHLDATFIFAGSAFEDYEAYLKEHIQTSKENWDSWLKKVKSVKRKVGIDE